MEMSCFYVMFGIGTLAAFVDLLYAFFMPDVLLKRKPEGIDAKQFIRRHRAGAIGILAFIIAFGGYTIITGLIENDQDITLNKDVGILLGSVVILAFNISFLFRVNHIRSLADHEPEKFLEEGRARYRKILTREQLSRRLNADMVGSALIALFGLFGVVYSAIYLLIFK